MRLSVFSDEGALVDPDLSALERNTWRNLEFTRACLSHAR